MSLYKKLIKTPLKKIGQSAPAMWLISLFIYGYVKLIGRTTKWHYDGIDRFYKLVAENDGVIFLTWHGRALMVPHFWNGSSKVYALVSLHRDGRMIAGLLERFDVNTIGGSSNENAVGSAISLMRAIKDNATICIIPDGPRGPRMHMGRSPIYFAQKTGKPIICASYSVKNSKIIEKAWDNMMIPLPFSEGLCRVSDPFFIPTDATEEELENYRRQIENTLNEISISCDADMGRTPILPDDGKTPRKKRSKK